MDQQYGPQNYNPAEWDTVEEKIDILKNIKLGDVIAWGIAGALLIAGVWQSANPAHIDPERGSVA